MANEPKTANAQRTEGVGALELRDGETVGQAAYRITHQMAIEKANAIFDELEKAGLIHTPPSLWSWGETVQETKRLILKHGFGITDVLPPVERRKKKDRPLSVAPNKKGKR
jgi:hypothetical protein